MPRSRMRKRLAMLLLLAMPTLTACAQLTSLIPSAETDLPAEVDPAKVACEAFTALTYERGDSEPTKAGIKGHNAAYCSLCSEYEPRCKPSGA